MGDPITHVVTGASGYTGRYIARRLVDGGARVRSLTGHVDRPSPLGDAVAAFPYRFDDLDEMSRSLEGADTLFNTYWIRFSRGDLTHEVAVRNSMALFDAAAKAGVRRIVHVSITNASVESPLPYFRGKALVERALKESGVSHAILRPTIIFGREDILLNNIAWALRRFPVHPIPGRGDYPVQPIYVEDLARLAVEAGAGGEDVEIDAVGPDVMTYKEMVGLVASKVGSAAKLVGVPAWLALALARIAGQVVGDVVLTREEVDGLTAGLLVSKSGAPPMGTTRLTDWLDDNADGLGAQYANELARHYR